MTNDKKRILELEVEVASLKALVQVLLEEIERLKHPKNSRNSSVPPSKDENRPLKTKSLRDPSGKKPGGQTGHQGNTLKMTDHPDHIVEHKPTYCNHCGNDLSHAKTELVKSRQVVDIPPFRHIGFAELGQQVVLGSAKADQNPYVLRTPGILENVPERRAKPNCFCNFMKIISFIWASSQNVHEQSR